MEEEITITIHPFRMGTDKEAALKPLEEAAETYAEWQMLDFCLSQGDLCKGCEQDGMRNGCAYRVNLANEIADCIQASVNLAARYGIDLPAAMKRCEERNRERGRYGD